MIETPSCSVEFIIEIDAIKNETKRKNEKINAHGCFCTGAQMIRYTVSVCVKELSVDSCMYWGWFVGTQKISHIPISRVRKRDGKIHISLRTHIVNNIYSSVQSLNVSRTLFPYALLSFYYCFFCVFFNDFIKFT